MKVNWEKLTMSFSNQGRIVTIQGDQSLKRTLVSSHTLKKEWEIAVVSVLWGVDGTNVLKKGKGMLI